MQSKIFTLSPETKVTYLNKKASEFCKDRHEYLNGICKVCGQWQHWKIYGELSEEEKEKINLAQYPNNCILFDKDFRDKEGKPIFNKEQLLQQYFVFKENLIKDNINGFLTWFSPAGFHVLVPFENFESLNSDLKKEVKRHFINKFACDPAKISDLGVVSLPEKPHFKNNEVYGVFEEKEGNNKLKTDIVKDCFDAIELKRKQNNFSIKQDEDFKNFFISDPFFLFIKNNVLGESSERNNIIFPNLALGAVKSGKTKEEIDEILKPIIKNNFPGKNYSEFEGWLKKAFLGDIKDFNYVLINRWISDHFEEGKHIYDLKPIELNLKEINKEDSIKIEKEKQERINLIWNNEINNLTSKETEWLVESWIPKGDIVFVAGKANSYKTTAFLHIALCISNNKLVFNKYKVSPSKVIYINEENHRQIFKSFSKRCSKSLLLDKIENFALSQEEGLKLDQEPKIIGQISDLHALAEIIKKQGFEVLIIDSFRRVIGFDENDASSINNFFNRLKQFRKICGNITIIFLHHMKKSSAKDNFDIRDLLRGSSDITNSADSVIAIERKTGKECFVISHIKCRSALEQDKKIIMVNSGDNKDEAYLYETEASANNLDISNTIEQCASKILKMTEDKKQSVFSRKEISDALKDQHSETIIFRALKQLEQDGLVASGGGGKNTKWVFSEIKKQNNSEEEKKE